MALIQANFMSRSLLRTVTINVILPVDKFSFADGKLQDHTPFKTLYLLHGILGNYTDWVSGTRIQRWAEEKNLAVVMPSGENGFYLDQEAQGNFYGRFIGEELVEITRKMFPLSAKREDTFLGGLSMGGYGAIRNGLKYHDTFGYIIAFSGALHILEEPEDADNPFQAYVESSFGDLREAAKSDKNPRVLIQELAKKKRENENFSLPEIFMACGTEDGLLGVNRLYHALFEENGFAVKYYESPGGHEWDFWDAYIKKALNWLPLDEVAAGVSSGSIDA